jgi:hypothetical protein
MRGTRTSGLATKAALMLVFLLTGTLGNVSGQYSDISYFGATVTEDASESRTVEISPNETYIASGYDGLVALHSQDTLNLIKTFPMGNDVLDIKFSPDGSYLAVARSGSGLEDDTIKIIDMGTLRFSSKQQSSNSQPQMISWAPDGQILAVPNGNNGVNLIRVSDMQVETSLSGEHNSRITCIEYSKLGNYILTGDENGRVVMWTKQGVSTDKVFNLESEIRGCSFDAEDENFAILTEGGHLSTWSFEGIPLSERNLSSGASLHWSSNGNQLHVLEISTPPRILSVDSSELEDIVSIYMGHQGLDFDIIENKFGTRQMAYVASNTGHIVAYGAPTLPAGYGESGADLDGDNIPDMVDDDDDGDAIPDSRDNNCITVTLACSKTPDIDTIRRVVMSANSTAFTIQDTFTLDLELSSILRNLSRKSIVADTRLSQEETDVFSQAICLNMNPNHYVSSWSDVLQLSSGQLEDGVVNCHVSSGMTLVGQNDQKTHVSVTYTSSFNMSEKLAYPFEFTLKSQPKSTDASLAQHAELHPIDITVQSIESDTFYWSPWWVSEGELEVNLNEQEAEELGIFELSINTFQDYPFLFIPVLGLFAAIAIAIIRKYNSLGMNLEIDDDDDDGDDDFDEQQKEESIEDVLTDEKDEDEVEDNEYNLESINDEQDTDEDADTEVVRTRRKTRTQSTANNSPAKKVKRKRLDTGVQSKKVQVRKRKTSSKKKIEQQQPAGRKVKTRRVVTYADKVGNDDD